MTKLYLVEPDAPGAAWAPFAGVRPIAELRAGMWRIRERWEAAVDADAVAVFGSHVEGFHEGDESPVGPLRIVEGPAIIGTSTFAPSGTRLTPAPGVRRLVHGGNTVGWVVREREQWTGPHQEGPAVEVDGLLLRGVFDLVTALEHLLAADCADLQSAPRGGIPEGSLVLGDPGRVVIRGASVEPGVVFDVRQGAVVLDAGVEVRHGARLEGPLYGGPGTKILGGFIRGSSFGPECRVHGEIAASVFLGFANKSHDGFLGHSVVGQWVNLGAGTTTSNLKNTYGPVRLDIDGERIETGRLNLGTLFGDHAKTAIGTMLATGTVVGAGANVFGPASPPKWVRPFAWGTEGREVVSEAGFLQTAERVMSRRGVELSSERRASLRRTYARGTAAG
jgi:UDP-N-acetylglucosamine diphosphorylase / glucose-1-phosphate thymidylyltransferase / UDP-N-acetylgalactosamine diphosphorylase / glucosamine-1-phosphate N-acetyltransferase / galactosamine-1-phosphate N-acetyltransferase